MGIRGATVAAICVLAVAPSCGSGSSGGGSAGGGDDGGASSSGGSGGSGSGSGGSGSGGSSSSGSGSSGGSGGSTSSSGSSGSSGGLAGDGGTCFGSAFLAALGKTHLILGGAMAAATAAQAPFDLQYQYISGGLPDGTGPCASCASGCTTNNGAKNCNGSAGCSWWGCWQYDQDPPGEYVRTFDSTCAGEKPAQVPMITYYQILQSSGVTEGAPEVTQAATNATFMARYFADWRFLLQQIGMTTALLHIEPDFWGYAEQHASDPTTEPAAVASANATDCASMPNTIAGMGQCMVAMVRKYAPHALVALHASAWSTNIDVAGNTDPSLNVAGEAQKTAAFLSACGENNADFVVVETSDRDAGYYQCQGRTNALWDATNATLPDYHQDFAWVKALTEALNKPALYWQTPLGNMNVADVCPEPSSGTITWHDNRVDYFLGHMSELAGAHAVGAAFGAGAGDQTTPETDGGNLVTKAKAYYAAGGQALCQ